MWLYFVALLSLVLAFATGRRWLVYLGTGTLLLAIGIHFTGFVLRCIIAERFAIQNQFESMTGLSLFATLVGLGVMTLKRQWLFGAAAAGVGFLVLITATQTGIPGVNVQKEAAILNTSVLLKYHVTTVLVSYGLISLGFIISLFYLGTYYAGKLKARAEVGAEPGAESIAAHALGLDESVNVGRQRVLADLDRALMTILQLAFWTLAVGIMLGAWWADHSWGRWWAFDPKETWALATWIIYLIVIHVRQVATKNRQLVTAWLGVLGFIVMLWTYFGVNLLLPGLHAYA
jgi:cytochrome c-type biogenesis protein CcsB